MNWSILAMDPFGILPEGHILDPAEGQGTIWALEQKCHPLGQKYQNWHSDINQQEDQFSYGPTLNSSREETFSTQGEGGGGGG